MPSPRGPSIRESGRPPVVAAAWLILAVSQDRCLVGVPMVRGAILRVPPTVLRTTPRRRSWRASSAKTRWAEEEASPLAAAMAEYQVAGSVSVPSARPSFFCTLAMRAAAPMMLAAGSVRRVLVE